MAKKVFLSYSWRDQHTADRLYRDLKKSNVPIWRDQIEGDPLGDFKAEFLRQVDECDYFIMCDSINYRKKSTFCIDEVERRLQNRKDDPKIIVCLLDKNGDWRLEYRNDREQAAFKEINNLKYYDLYYTGYDNEVAYNRTLNAICDLLGVTYERWNKEPSAQDLDDEIKLAMSQYDNSDVLKKLNKHIEDVIKPGYQLIVHKMETNCPNVGELYKVWVEDCQSSGMNLLFPKWAYAVWYTNQSGANLYNALSLFTDIASQHPKDFRGYRGVGHLAAMIGEELKMNGEVKRASDYFKLAEVELKKSMSLMDDWQTKHCVYGDLFTLGTVYYETSRIDDAQSYWEKALEIKEQCGDGDLDECLIDQLFKVKVVQEVPLKDIEDWLLALLKKHPTDPVLYHNLGWIYCKEHRFDDALLNMQKAYSLSRSLDSLYYLLKTKKTLGLHERQDLIKVEEAFGTLLDSQEDKEWASAILKLFRD